MKYELNTPYDFDVRNLVEEDGSLFFHVEVGEHLFPVRAYQEQLQAALPSKVSCLIVQDKNKEAYLVQNKATLYPSLYKPNRRYLFEIVDIKDSYVIMQDKYGLYHKMDKGESKYSLNEIVVREVKVIIDSSSMAHLIFYYNEPAVTEKTVDSTVRQENVPVTYYPPTIFEQDTPKVSSTHTTDENKKEENRLSSSEKKKNDYVLNSLSVPMMITTRDWDHLSVYLKHNLQGGKIRVIQQDVLKTFENEQSAELYWETVLFLLKYDAHIFIGTIAKIDISKFKNVSSGLENSDINDIVHISFSNIDKIKFAIDITMPLKDQLTIEHKNFIQEKGANISSSETFYSLFKLLGLSPNEAVYYMLTMPDNNVAAFTLYKFYMDGKKGNRFDEKSPFEVFRPSKIRTFISMMEGSKSISFKLAANLINKIIFDRGSCPYGLQEAVNVNGMEGFTKYINRIEHQTNTKNFIGSLSKGDYIKGLSFVKELDNYYHLIEQGTGTNVLLDKDLTTQKPVIGLKCEARIAKKLSNKGKTVFIVTQKPVPLMYGFPPLVNKSRILDVSFSERGVGNWYPEVKNYTKLLNIEIGERPRFVNYKQRQKARIIRKMDFFTYIVKIL